MPVLKTHENKIFTSVNTINNIIYPNSISEFSITDVMHNIANAQIFDDELTQKLISTLPASIVEDYRKMNLIYPGIFYARNEIKNELDKKLKEYEQMHTNNCDEIQHVINGSVMFGFVNADGAQSVVLLFPGEKIFIDKDSEHWGSVTDDYYATLITYRSVSYINLATKKTGTSVLVNL